MNDRSRETLPPDGLDRWLRETMTSEDGAVGSECLDPDTLAAWAEGSLSGTERSFAEAHAARCARCQAMLAVMARTIPPAAASPRPSFRKWVMMLTPAAAAAAAVALWFAVEPQQRDVTSSLQQPSSISGTNARDDRPAPPAAPAPPVETPSPAPPASAPVPSAANRAKDAEQRDVAAGSPDRKREAFADSRAAASRRAETRADEAKGLDLRKEVDALRPPASPAATPAPPPAAPVGAVSESVAVVQQKPQSQRQAAQEEERLQRLRAGQQQAPPPAPQQSVQQTAQLPSIPPAPPLPPAEPKPAAPPTGERAAAAEAADKSGRADTSLRAAGGAAGRGGSAPAANEGQAQFRTGLLAQPVAVAPDGKTRWRIADRLVQQSRDGGANWQTQYTLDEGLMLVSGSAPSASVCWFVGAAGAIVTTSDGRTWRRVSFPSRIDLIGVTSSDVRNATVVTSDKRLFVTTDGGARWEVKRD